MSQNPQIRQAFLGVTVPVTAAAQPLTTLIEQTLGLTPPGVLAHNWREVNWEFDPQTAVTGGAAYIMIGNANVGTTLNGVVQKGMSLATATSGEQLTNTRSVWNNVDLSLVYVRTNVGTAALNLELWAM